ncbi:proline-rich receptor-like protein kinase PERK5 [Phragmites australis]|uniref:proline-rich receptor-like protein kinase PERK5 n=1 Tax=Phragmites australis TaxID=29695 RepID=UPI002D76E16D|nr:proline-rich receptor-like protein kinase PERK5 [Phragmites australis]
MSLVAYDASSDEDAAAEPPAAATASPPLIASSIVPQPRPPSPSTSVGAAPQPTPPSPRQNVAPTSSSNVSLPTPSLDLPDVADLFAPPSLQSLQSRATGHSSRENASRKRESNGSTFNDSCSKFPRMQSLPHGSRSAAGNTLIPPQLRGRSNVVTEDMSKLFVAQLKE